MSFTVAWNGVIDRVDIHKDPVYRGFGGRFVDNTAQMEWTGQVGDFSFVSSPMAESSSAFALLGHEQTAHFSSKDEGTSYI